MYNLIRKIHLYTGLIVLVFLMMYFVSGYVLIHREWFGGQRNKPDPATVTQSLADYTGPRDPRPLAEHVADLFALRGRINFPAAQPNHAIRFNIFRPGSVHQIEIPHDGDAVTITTLRENLAGILVHLHRIHGYGGGWLWNAFVLFNDLASFSCILFALSGIYLWWKTAKRKIWGMLCLGASCAYGVGMILYLMYAR